mgnify:CR=1 FL=1
MPTLTVRPDRLKLFRTHADPGNVLIVFGIVSIWLFVGVAVVSLCVMARRGDEALALTPPPAVEDVPWVATLAEPEPAATPQPRATSPGVRQHA